MLSLGGVGYWAGDHNRNNAWLAKQAQTEQQARLDYASEVVRGQVAASRSIAEQQKLQQGYSLLEGKFNELARRGPLVVYKDRTPVGVSTGSAAGSLAGPGTRDPLPGQLPGQPGVAADGDLSLSLGAVWLWNSALTGTDTPAGACGAADTAKPACAADSGIGLEAAWANHAANAKSCAIDRARHQRLIDYVSTTPNVNGQPHGF